MKAISLLQPWATLVVIGAKKLETRSWQTKYRGRLLIQASQSKKEANKMIYKFPFNEVLCNHYNREFEIDVSDLPFGSIIGYVDLVDCISTDDAIRKMDPYKSNEKYFGDYGPNRFAWVLENPVQFKEPIPCKGALSIWNCSDDVVSVIQKCIYP